MDIKNTPLVSIMMVARNMERYIATAIESILAQTYRNWELIITDDTSTDATRHIVTQYVQKDQRIKLIPIDVAMLQTPRIPTIAASRGKYIAVLDADDISFPGRLAEQVAFLEAHPDIAVVGSAAELIDPEGHVIGKKGKTELNAEIVFCLLLQTQFIHSTVCMRRDAYDAVGGYENEKYRLSVEDYDLWNKFAQHEYHMANLPSTLIQYRIHPQGMTQSDSSGARANLSTDVSEHYIRFFLDIPREKVRLLTDMVNGEKLSLTQTVSALWWYRVLTRAYCTKKKLSTTEKSVIDKVYRERTVHVIKTEIKKLIARFQ